MEASLAAMDLNDSIHDDEVEEKEDETMEETGEEDIIASASEDEDAVSEAEQPHKKRKIKDKWLKDIRKYQASTELLIPRLPFKRLVREIAQDYKDELRFTEEAFDAIQTAAEAYLIDLFTNTNKITIAKGHDTITPVDMQLVRDILKSMMGWQVGNT